MPFTTLRMVVALLPGLLLAGGALQSAAPDPGTRYLPLREGTRLIYITNDGERFTFTYGAQAEVRWFDGTVRRVVPVEDTRCACQVLFHNVDGEIRAIGALRHGELDRWGEYYVIWPAGQGHRTETVVTPAGRFEQAVRVTTSHGTAWFAPGIGIVKSDSYMLTAIDNQGGGRFHAAQNGS